MAQAHARDRARHARRLERVVPGRLAGLDVAEAAAAGARVAEDHERRGAALPALADVGAGRLLADGVQVLLADQLGQLAVARAAGRGHLEPRRLALAQRADLGAEHLEHVHAARVGSARVACARAACARLALGGERLGAGARRRRRSVLEVVPDASHGAATVQPGAVPRARGTSGPASMPSRHGETSRWRRSCAAQKRWPRGGGSTAADALAPLDRDEVIFTPGEPAGDHPGERLQVVLDVDREAVRGHAARHVHADRGDLAILGPHAGRAPRARRRSRPGRPARR